MRVNPGKLDKNIQIIAIIPGEQDAEGFREEDREHIVRTCFAQHSKKSGTEIWSSGAVFGEDTHRFLVRSVPEIEIDTGMIVRYRDRDYDIKYVHEYDEYYTEIWATIRKRVVRDGD